MMKSEDKFFCLLQMSVGNEAFCNLFISNEEWYSIYNMAIRQSLVGVVLDGIHIYVKSYNEQKPPIDLLYKWIGQYEQIRNQNKLLNKQCRYLNDWFKQESVNCCVLKGQGNAFLYNIAESRQPGDIDIWVNQERDEIVSIIRSKGVDVSSVDYVDCHALFFSDTIVEVHFRPTYMFNPFYNKRLQNWIEQNKEMQMNNFDNSHGFQRPTTKFNLVFSMIHIYRHIFGDGIGLRQIMDYYYILRNSTQEDRIYAYETLRHLGIGKFVSTIMYVLIRIFRIEHCYLLSKPNQKEGMFLIDEIIRGGNFGKYDDRIINIPAEQRIKRGLLNVKRNLRYLIRYPNEVIWLPAWKLWHWGWRKKHGYI